jgi:hypothetical protein
LASKQKWVSDIAAPRAQIKAKNMIVGRFGRRLDHLL